tara:strand:+ start:18644 stop:19759 length:1116 start_codon:yes stop_codon:yes gene_type:complete
MSKIKILFIIDALSRGGKERRLVELLKRLSNDKLFSCHLLILSNNIKYHEIYDLNIRIHILERKKKIDYSIFKSFYKLCGNLNPDLIHSCNSLASFYALPTVILRKIIFINAMISTAPINLFLDKKVWLRAKLTFPFSDIIISNSYEGLKSFNVSEDKGKCIHNGFDFNRVKNLNLSNYNYDEDKGKIIGMVATFSDNKDYCTFVKSAENILRNKSNITFIAVGDGKNLKKIQSLVSRKYLSNFKFLGNQNNVEEIINTFDVGVLFTNKSIHGEGISNSIMEYMALKKPVIATNTGGTKEIVIHNKTGYLVEDKDVNDIQEKIELLLSDRIKAEEFGTNGYERIKNDFNLTSMVNSYKNVYLKLINKKQQT